MIEGRTVVTMTSSPPASPVTAPAPATSRGPVLLALLVDVVLVVVFAATGRGTHEHGTAALQVLATAWPFLVGAGAGWLVARGWQRPFSARLGLVVWVATWALGMGLRAATGQGTAVPFLIVAAAFLALLVLWRVVAGLLLRRRP